MKQWILIAALALLLQNGDTQAKNPPKQPAGGSKTTTQNKPASGGAKQPAQGNKPPVTPAKQGPGIPAMPAASTVVATVNGAPITAGDLAKATYDWFGANTIEELVLEKIVEQEAAKLKVTVSHADVQKRYEESLENAKRQAPPGMEIDDFLKRSQFPPSRLYTRTRTQLLAEKLVERNVNLNDWVQYRQIVVRIQGNTPDEQSANEAEAQKKADEAYEKITAGMDFVEAVTAYSDDTFTKDQGGLVNFQKKDFLFPDIKTQLDKMKPGEVSKPFKTVQGFLIIKFEKMGGQGTPEEQKQLREQSVRIDLSNYVRSLQDKAKVTNKIVKPYTPPAQPNPGTGSPRPNPGGPPPR